MAGELFGVLKVSIRTWLLAAKARSAKSWCRRSRVRRREMQAVEVWKSYQTRFSHFHNLSGVGIQNPLDLGAYRVRILKARLAKRCQTITIARAMAALSFRLSVDLKA